MDPMLLPPPCGLGLVLEVRGGDVGEPESVVGGHGRVVQRLDHRRVRVLQLGVLAHQGDVDILQGNNTWWLIPIK